MAADRTSRKSRPASPGRRRFLKRLAGGFICAAAPTAVYAHEVEPFGVRVARVDAAIRGLPEEADGLVIGHISDTHADSDRALGRTANAALLLREQNPDAVFLTGDFITREPLRRMGATADALRPLADTPCGAYAVLGNHDWWAGDPDHVESELRRVGMEVLRNRALRLRNHALWVVGLEQRCDSRQDADKALEDVPESAIKLLLIHEPDYADEAPEGFALQFSGHSHGGQVRIPLLPPIIVPTYSRRYPEGLRKAEKHLVYTTRGVGMVRPNFRLFCPPEVGVIRLRRA